MEESIKVYWRAVLPPAWQGERGIQNFEDVAHVIATERGMSIEEARETIKPLTSYQKPHPDYCLCDECASLRYAFCGDE